MSSKVKIYYDRRLFSTIGGKCEKIFCAPFENPSSFEEEDFENQRFRQLVEEGRNHIEFSEIGSCDYVFVPYKWPGYNPEIQSIINSAKSHGKKIITLHNDDFAPPNYPSSDDGYIFTTTIQRSNRRVNEFSFPAFTGDFFDQFGGTYLEDNLMSIGFCGAITHQIRPYVLNRLQNNMPQFKKDFIIRRSFWATGELTKDEARIGYFQNMKDNCFTIVMRGGGNFSYRMYETMMMGRIPIIVDSDQVFPFENEIDYNASCVMISLSNINNIENIITSWVSSKTKEDLIAIQSKNRDIWREFFSPLGWIKNFHREIR